MSRAERHQQARDATRRAILDAALELFVADGYAQVSIRNVAAKVEYSPGAIYSYFPSKDAIFFALAEEGFRLLDTGRLTNAPTGDPLEDLRAIAWRLYEFSNEQPQYFALVFLDRHVPRIGREEYEQFAFMTELKKRLLARVQRCIDERVFPPPVRADVALRLLWAPIIGITSFQVSQRLPPEVDAGALVRDAIDTTLAGLCAGAPVHSVSSRLDRPEVVTMNQVFPGQDGSPREAGQRDAVTGEAEPRRLDRPEVVTMNQVFPGQDGSPREAGQRDAVTGEAEPRRLDRPEVVTMNQVFPGQDGSPREAGQRDAVTGEAEPRRLDRPEVVTMNQVFPGQDGSPRDAGQRDAVTGEAEPR